MKKLLTFAVALFLTVVVFGQANKWIGPAAGGSWTNPANWSLGVPVPGDWVRIATGATTTITDVPEMNYRTNLATNGLGAFHIWPAPGGAFTHVKLVGAGGPVILAINALPPDPTRYYDFLVQTNCSLDLNFDPLQPVALELGEDTYIQMNGAITPPPPFQKPIVDPLDPWFGKLAYFSFRLINFIPPFNNSSYLQPWAGSVTGFVQIDYTPDVWHFISSPVNPSNTCCVFESDYFSYFTESTGAWTPVTGAFPLVVGKGYEVWDDDATPHPTGCPPCPSGPMTSYHEFYGPINSGDIALPLTYTDAAHGWNLVGNPYPCAVDLGQGPQPSPPHWIWNTAVVQPTAYFWYSATGSYYSYNWLLGTYVGFPTRGLARRVPAMQGFFVKAIATPAAGDLTVKQTAQIPATFTAIYKDDELTPNSLRINVASNGNDDEMLIYFNEGATNNFDPIYDAEKLFPGNSSTSQIYSRTPDNKELVMNGVALAPGNVSVPVSVVVNASGTHTMNFSDFSTFAPNTGIILTDLVTNATQDIKANPVYTFTANVGDDPNRFVIFFTDVLSGVNNISDNTFKVYSNESAIYIQNNTSKSVSGTIMVYDMLGKKVMQKNLDNSLITRLNTNLEKGFYLVSVITTDGSYNQKVYIN